MDTQQTQTAPTYTEEKRRQLIREYFQVTSLELPPPDNHLLTAVLAWVIGIILMSYLKNAAATVGICFICFVIATWQSWLYISPYIKRRNIFRRRRGEDVMSSWLIKDFKETVKPQAIKSLSLNMSDVRAENFIIIPIPIYWDGTGIDTSQAKRCPMSDGSFNYSMWRVQVLVLTKHYISLFKCIYNWLDNSVSNIITNEFYFQDITSIRNEMRELELNFLDSPETPIGAGKVFCVTNFSGEYLSVISDIPSLHANKSVSVDLEYVVSLLRMVIRNRRFGITHEQISTQEQQAITNEQAEAAQREQATEDINSIEYLLHKRDVEMNQEESQYGTAPASSFGNDDGNEPGMPDMPDLGTNNN